MKMLFVGGGNMASAIIGGLLRDAGDGIGADAIAVVDPSEEQRARLERAFGVRTVASTAQADPVDLVVWAVKPQSFAEAARAAAGRLRLGLQLSVMAGVRAADIARRTGAAKVVRTMPNTPALIGMGIAGAYANAACNEHDRLLAAQVLRPTGELLWLDDEAQLDAVTALSGSGPAYVFYFIEAMMQAAVEMGLSAEHGRRLALATFAGAAELARRSDEPPAELRARVTSKGGTTHAAITAMEAAAVGPAFVAAMHAARRRAAELGDELAAASASD
jgi:pyrroline-5-carboxylate reductase